ncbi:hypothetical protein QL285_021934 [Trifolium repens]|nr:hypothetical protein QL285_021934 [Trifolium repens]
MAIKAHQLFVISLNASMRENNFFIKMRENICEDRRVIERNGFKKFSKKNQRRIVSTLDAVSWNMMSKKHQNILLQNQMEVSQPSSVLRRSESSSYTGG